MPITTTPSERIGLCTRMRRFLVRFIRPESFVHTRSSAGFTITTSGFKFSVHTPRISIRQYARLVHRWIESIGLESAFYGTHSMRRTKAAQIYRKTGNLRAVQLLLGHTKLESTVRYLGIEVDDALNIAEQIEL